MMVASGSKLSLEDFVGAWQIERNILDKCAQANGRLTGTATFAPSENGLSYFESGLLELPGHTPFQAERRYQWRFIDDEIVVEFQDGRPFHRFDPGSPSASHWCDPDTYNVKYEFSSWPKWRSIWDVSGPKKDYQMITTYTRNPI